MFAVHTCVNVFFRHLCMYMYMRVVLSVDVWPSTLLVNLSTAFHKDTVTAYPHLTHQHQLSAVVSLQLFRLLSSISTHTRIPTHTSERTVLSISWWVFNKVFLWQSPVPVMYCHPRYSEAFLHSQFLQCQKDSFARSIILINVSYGFSQNLKTSHLTLYMQGVRKIASCHLPCFCSTN